MKQVVIESPVIDSPYVEPIRHFKFSDDEDFSEVMVAMESTGCISGEELGEETLFSFKVANSENIVYSGFIIVEKIKKG